MHTNICIIHTYWGCLPEWFPYFVSSCRCNSTINFIFFSDCFPSESITGNIHYIPFTLSDFNTLASNKLGIKVALENPYKNCDFKPSFGKIFEDYILPFKFWGYCDNDLIFGNIRQFITEEILNQYDVISTYKGFLSGPFCLYRNNPEILELYTRAPGNKYIFSLPDDCIGFDENILRKANEGFKIKKLVALFLFFFQNNLNVLLSFSLREFRYQFQWFYKQWQLKDKIPLDMTEVIWEAERTTNLNCHFEEMLFSDAYFRRQGKFKWELTWQSGTLFEKYSKQEIIGFHFIESKSNAAFSADKNLDINQPFKLDHVGLKLLKPEL